MRGYMAVARSGGGSHDDESERGSVLALDA
jgi:hypothetical protein